MALGLTSGGAVSNYAAYRASAAGGSFKPVIADIDELVDQFAFGIKKHPLSIKNFLGFALDLHSIAKATSSSIATMSIWFSGLLDSLALMRRCAPPCADINLNPIRYNNVQTRSSKRLS